MLAQKKLEDYFTSRKASLAPTPKSLYAHLAALTTHGGFMSVLPLVVEFLACGGEPLWDLKLEVGEDWPKSPVYYKPQPGERQQMILALFEGALADARKRHSNLRVLRLVSKAWREASRVAYDRELFQQAISVPFPFRCLRSLNLDLMWIDGGLDAQMRLAVLPPWFDKLPIEKVEFYGGLFRVPRTGLPRLRQVSSDYGDLALEVEALRDRPLEVIDYRCDPGGGFYCPWFDEKIARLFVGTECGRTLRELSLYAEQRFVTLPDGIRGLRLTKLDITFTNVTAIPDWLGEMPLVELILAGTRIESLPRSLQSCGSLRILNLCHTPLGSADASDPGHDWDLGPRVLVVPPGLVAPRGADMHLMTLEDVPQSEIRRRTSELTAVSLALPDLRIRFSFHNETRDWHVRCGKPWTDPAFDDKDDF